MPIRNLSQYATALDSGKFSTSPIYKISIPNGGASRWVDLSMGAGTPKFNAYVGGQYESTPLTGTGNAGIYVGSAKRYLHRWMMNSQTAGSLPYSILLMDYVMFYPLIDMDSTDAQDMENVLPLPRYTNGVGVRMMAVITTPMTGTTNCTVRYDNQDGVSKSVTFSVINAPTTGLICSSASTNSAALSANSPFLPLASGDTGVLRITSVTNSVSAGGFISIVLVVPLASLGLLEQGVPTEVEFPRQLAQMKEIKQGAYLNMIALQGSGTPPTGLIGLLETVAE